MSIEIVLIPLAFAAVSAWQASRAERTEDGRLVHQVGSRMRDEEILCAALADTGAQVDRSEGALRADWAGVAASFTRDDQGIWSVRVTGDADQTRAIDLVTTIDAAYGRRVQQAVIATLRSRAAGAGMAVESEVVDEDQAVTLTLTVSSGA